jgi:LuxR family maltose regulon positive regulatory protein
MPVISGEGAYFQRERIDGILEKSLQSFVTIITAGEGYGKTYAVSSFLRRRPERIIWIPLSERDNNPWRFWENFTGAVRYYNPSIGKSLAELGIPETVRQVHRNLTALEKAMVPGYSYAIVIDDVHLVHAKPVLEFMERVLSVPISNQSFMFIGRQESALNTIPLLSKGRLSRIGADELRFNEKEIGDFLAFRNIPSAPEALKDMYRDTEGWALAINFLAGEMEKSGEN